MTFEDKASFYATRVAVPLGTKKSRRKQMAVTNLVYSKCDYKTQKGLDESRAKEWSKWNSFDAAAHLPDALLQELIEEGHPTFPTQWVETDKKGSPEETLKGTSSRT